MVARRVGQHHEHHEDWHSANLGDEHHEDWHSVFARCLGQHDEHHEDWHSASLGVCKASGPAS